MADGAWRDVVLLTIRETPSKKADKPNEGFGMWVVMRLKPDNTVFNVTVKSGRYYPNKLTGAKELPKDGFNYYDFMELKKPAKKLTESVRGCTSCGAVRQPTAWDEIVALLDPKNPPPVPVEEVEQKEEVTEDPPKMPWE